MLYLFCTWDLINCFEGIFGRQPCSFGVSSIRLEILLSGVVGFQSDFFFNHKRINILEYWIMQYNTNKLLTDIVDFEIREKLLLADKSLLWHNIIKEFYLVSEYFKKFIHSGVKLQFHKLTSLSVLWVN